jgi:pre-mRNA branch site protein p14
MLHSLCRPPRTTSADPVACSALFVKNLSFNVTPEDLFDLFGKFGPVRYVSRDYAPPTVSSERIADDCSQIRQGIANNTKGTAFVVYEDVMDAKSACDKLNGFNFQNRYLVGAFLRPVSALLYSLLLQYYITSPRR